MFRIIDGKTGSARICVRQKKPLTEGMQRAMSAQTAQKVARLYEYLDQCMFPSSISHYSVLVLMGGAMSGIITQIFIEMYIVSQKQGEEIFGYCFGSAIVLTALGTAYDFIKSKLQERKARREIIKTVEQLCEEILSFRISIGYAQEPLECIFDPWDNRGLFCDQAMRLLESGLVTDGRLELKLVENITIEQAKSALMKDILKNPYSRQAAAQLVIRGEDSG